ncbi:XRE family transcriptional regulator [Nguyenibacter sp. L1]|uniref:helix-turn-helix domain-containing protein n=1 Tax=Nguyenibacter sp. L1 TaxID=3049350 RepID=UPI002B4867D2|nr:XRE family transcriptional regulator [Nguyenibacter sp. L1]WRH87722.1 XRE family transcriptional regulator [Nguyenibacter sp. L1]
MSTIQDDITLSALEHTLAARLRAERVARGWSLSDLAIRSGVSRAMISKVERAEASPTATVLGRLSGAFGLTLSTLLARAEGDASGAGRIMRGDAQPLWRDPATGYLRRAVSPPGAEPELVHVELPPGACVNYPAAAYAHLDGQCVWVLAGALSFRAGTTEHHLAAGDCLTLGLPLDCAFHNPSESTPCTYLVAISRMQKS